MAQAPLNVPNGSGSAVRTSINQNLLALATLNSGANEPAITFPNMLWFDTTNLQLKKRNNANTAFTIIGQEISGQFVPFSQEVALTSTNVPRLTTTNRYSARQSWNKGATLTAAATLTIGNDGNSFDVTGATGITALSDAGAAGTFITLRFLGAPTLTNSSSLVLPGGANITVNPNDIMQFLQLTDGASPDWICYNYQPSSTNPVTNAGSIFLVQDTTLGADGTIDLTDFPTSFETFKLYITNFRPSGGVGGDTNGLQLQFSNDALSSTLTAGYQYLIRQDAVGADINSLNNQSAGAAVGQITLGANPVAASITNAEITLQNINNNSRPAIARCRYTIQQGASIGNGVSTLSNADALGIDSIRLSAINTPFNMATNTRALLYGIRG